MFFGSLFSAYILLRTGAASWPDPGTFLDLPLALVNTALLVAASGLIADGGSTHRTSEGPGFSRGRLYLSAALGAAFLGVKVFDYQSTLDAGLYPSTNILLACWFTLTAVHALHVAAGVGANLWLTVTAKRIPPAHARERLHATSLYWFFVDAVWIAILIAFYVL